MIVKSRERLMLEMINSFLTEEEGEFVLLELAGGITVRGGTSKKKYQFIKSDIALPYDAINDAFDRDNIAIIQNTRLMHLGVMPKAYISEKVRDMISKDKKDFIKSMEKYPKVVEAINNLKKALEEAREETKDETVGSDEGINK